MSKIIKGACDGCHRSAVDVFTHNQKCIICTRLDGLEVQIDNMISIVGTATKAIEAMQRYWKGGKSE